MSIHTNGSDSESNFYGGSSGRRLAVELMQVKFVQITNQKETPHHAEI